MHACCDAERGIVYPCNVTGRSGLAAREYGGGTNVFASFAVQIKLEDNESTVLVADNEPPAGLTI